MCGIEIHVVHQATELLCTMRPGVPRPKHGGNVGDPYVQIAATGLPQLVLISQDSYVTSKLKTLAPGTTWKSVGVTCTVASAIVTCSNGSRHGFTIGNHKYKSF